VGRIALEAAMFRALPAQLSSTAVSRIIPLEGEISNRPGFLMKKLDCESNYVQNLK
jgi:hypothetical protein